MQTTLIGHIQSIGIAEIWKIILNLVDYVVVAFLIFISFANILKIQIDAYAVKKTIPSLVLGVVLANLSWYICIMIVDFASLLVLWEQKIFVLNILSKNPAVSSYLTKYLGADLFVGTGASHGGFLNLMFVAIFKPVLDVKGGGLLLNLMVIIGGTVAGPAGLIVAATQLPGVFQTLLGALLFLVQLILLLFVYFMFIVRVVIIDMLIISSPLAFLAIGFPMTQKLFQQWWSQFARWVFMAPLAFFVWSIGIVIALSMEPTGATNFITGIIKYVMLGACLYFSVKLPFMLGGGIMSAWGGLGARIGKWAGRAANDKFGDWTANGMKIGNKQLWKNNPRRVDFIGGYQGWVAGAAESHQRKISEGAGTVRDFREGILGAPSRLISQKDAIKDILAGEDKDKMAQVARLGMGTRWEAGGQNAMMENIRKDLPNLSGWSDEYLQQNFEQEIKNKDQRKAATALAEAANRGSSWANKGQNNFISAFGETAANAALLKSIERDSRRKEVVQNYLSERVTPFVSGLDVDAKTGKVRSRSDAEMMNSYIDQMQNDGHLNKNANFPKLAQYLQKEKDQKWDASHFAAFSYLDQNKNNLDSSSRTILDGLRTKYESINPPAVQDATHDLFNKIDTAEIGDVIKGQMKVLVTPEIELGTNAKVLKSSAAHFLSYIRNNRPGLIRKLGITDTNMQEALGKMPINPIMPITPKLRFTPNAKLAEVVKIKNPGASSDIIKKLSDIDALPKELNLSDEVQLSRAIEVHEKHGELQQSLQSVFDGSEEAIKDIFQQGGNTSIDQILKTDVNVRNEITKHRESLAASGIKNSDIDEHIITLEKIQASKQKIDSTRDAVGQYKSAKDSIKKFMEDKSGTSTP